MKPQKKLSYHLEVPNSALFFLLLNGPVFKLVYLSSEVEEEKSDTTPHDIHPGPIDPYAPRNNFFFLQKKN